MTAIMIDGFDTYNGTGANTGAGVKWLFDRYNNNFPTFAMVAGRFGGQAVRIGYTAGSTACGGGSRSLPAPLSTVACGFAYRTSNREGHAVSILPTIFGLYSDVSAVWHTLLCVFASGAIGAYRATGSNAGTLLGASPNDTIKNNVWHYIEVEAVIHDTLGRIKVKVDGNVVVNVTNVDTQNGGAGTVDKIVIASTNGSAATVNADFDDIYVTDDGVSLGERRVETLTPNADVVKTFVPNAGTTNYTQVDELPNNGDTDYVQGSAVGDTDTYDFTNLSSNSAGVDAVQFVSYARKTDAATRALALQAVVAGSSYDGPATNLSASYTKIERLMTSNPNTGGAWNYATVNALRGGPKVAA